MTPEEAKTMVLNKHPMAVVVPTFKHDCGWMCIYNMSTWFRKDQILLGEAKDEDGGESAAWLNAAQRLEDK